MFGFQHRNVIPRRPTSSFTVRPQDTILLPDATGGAITATLFGAATNNGDHTLIFQQIGNTVNAVTIVDETGVTVATLTGQYATAILQMDENGTWIVVTGTLSGLASFVSGDATLSAAGVLTVAAGVITRAKMSGPAGRQAVQRVGGTIATTSTTDEYIVVPEAGSLQSAELVPLVALTANDTNYITWTIVNLGQSGGGSTAMLAVSDANTTKATGGAGLAINTKRTLTIHGTAANLVVAAGDLLRITATATGTLANTVTRPLYQLRFSGLT